MHPVDIENCLNSMIILVDSREKPTGEQSERRYKSFLCSYERQKLDFGDYSAKFMLDNEWIQVPVAIERKMNLDELAACFTHERKRFCAEFERAKAAGCSMYLLVENASWEGLINGRYRSRFNSKAYLASISAWIARYDIKPIFCKSDTSGRLINEILYREIKERLENGMYG